MSTIWWTEGGGCEGFYVGGAGNVTIIAKRGGAAVTLTACIVGQYYPIACSKIMATTTAVTYQSVCH